MKVLLAFFFTDQGVLRRKRLFKQQAGRLIATLSIELQSETQFSDVIMLVRTTLHPVAVRYHQHNNNVFLLRYVLSS